MAFSCGDAQSRSFGIAAVLVLKRPVQHEDIALFGSEKPPDAVLASQSGAEGTATATGVGGIGIIENESPPHHLLLEVDGGAVEIEVALDRRRS